MAIAPETWFAYVTTVLLLMSTPGPSHLLMLSNSMQHGARRAAATAAGDLSANSLQIVIAATGLAGVIHASRDFFVVVKWCGVAYLVYLGMRMFRGASAGAAAGGSLHPARRELFVQGFVTSAANPKAVIFFAALFPLFVDPTRPAVAQFAMLGLTYLVIDGTFLLFYGGFARWIATRYERVVGARAHRISGVLLVLAAVILGMKDVRESS